MTRTDTPEQRDEPAQAELTLETFRRLLEEGRELRRQFELRTAPMRIITPDDLKIRSR